MVTDFIVGFFHTLGGWIVGLLPEVEGMEGAWWSPEASGWASGGFATAQALWTAANYWLPVTEFFGLLAIMGGIYLAVALVRFAIRLIPGVG